MWSWFIRSYGLDVQDGFAEIIARIEAAGCNSMADAIAFISLGDALSTHAAVRCIDDPVLLKNFLRVAQWYTGLGLSFLRGKEARQARFIAVGSPTLQ